MIGRKFLKSGIATWAVALSSLLLPVAASAGPLDDAQTQRLLAITAQHRADLTRDALAIWGFAEVGYKEHKSLALLQERLRKAGFTVTANVAGMPTAFVASFKQGEGGPVLGVLAEFDALPGLSQAASAERRAIPGQAAGHGCGHNLFGAASVSAAISLKDWMRANGVRGEIRVFGAPAEEGGSGKVYLVRGGLFDDVDAVLHWHPSDSNDFASSPSLANISGKFRFRGVSAHAAGAPETGRSALDGVQIMNIAVEHLREHVPAGTRIHYVITNGGGAPNVVPDFAEVYYYARHKDPEVVRNVWGRIVKASQGAALASETRVENEITGGVMSLLVSKTLLGVAERNFRRVPIAPWNDAEKAFVAAVAGKPAESGAFDPVPIRRSSTEDKGGSTDVADVSWVVPTIGITTTTWVPGVPAHSWQATAASGSSIGTKGAFVAAQALALIGAELLQSPDTLAAAKAELAAQRGADFVYRPMLGDRKPALDYRDPAAGRN